VVKKRIKKEWKDENMICNFTLLEKSGSRAEAMDIRGAVCCGYTGRNQSAVRQHIEELAKAGVKPPPSVPAFYPKPPAGVELEEEIFAPGKETSGEVEFVLLLKGKEIWVGVGSDHTDRDLERLDILKSKQVCPATMSRSLWKYGEIKDHWDQIEIRSFATKDGKKVLYQESTVGTILPPEELIRLVQEKVAGPLEGIAIYSGTPPLKTEAIIFADLFEGELYDPILKRKLTMRYFIHPLDWFRG
jgi:hypothetical protein